MPDISRDSLKICKNTYKYSVYHSEFPRISMTEVKTAYYVEKIFQKNSVYSEVTEH